MRAPRRDIDSQECNNSTLDEKVERVEKTRLEVDLSIHLPFVPAHSGDSGSDVAVISTLLLPLPLLAP